MRPRFLIYGDIMDELGGTANAAALFGVSEVCARKYKEDPDLSGREMPVMTLQGKLIPAIACLPSERPQCLLDELLSHFALPARRRLIRQENFTLALDLLHNRARQKHYAEFCERGHPLAWVWKDGELRPFCIGCGGGRP